MVMIVEQLVEGMSDKENEALRENLPQCRPVHHRFHMA
jgi:hypothetical protein